MKATYPDGTPWDNTKKYSWKGNVLSIIYPNVSVFEGGGCVAFAFMASDAAFDDLPAYKYTDASKIRVGDFLRLDNDNHSVIVLTRNGNNITVAEGNYNSSVNWGRTIDITNCGFSYGYTRYGDPEEYTYIQEEPKTYTVKTYDDLINAKGKAVAGDEIIVDGEITVEAGNSLFYISFPADVTLSFSANGKINLTDDVTFVCLGTLVTSADFKEFGHISTGGYNAPRIGIINFYNDGIQNHAVWKCGNVTITLGDYDGSWEYNNSSFEYLFDIGSGDFFTSDYETNFVGKDDNFDLFKQNCYGDGKYVINDTDYYASEGKLQKSNDFIDLRYEIKKAQPGDEIVVSKEIVFPENSSIRIKNGVTLKINENGKIVLSGGSQLWIEGTLDVYDFDKSIDVQNATGFGNGLILYGNKNQDDTKSIIGKIVSKNLVITVKPEIEYEPYQEYINMNKGLNYQGLDNPKKIFYIEENLVITDPDGYLKTDEYAWSGDGKVLINGVDYYCLQDKLVESNDFLELRNELDEATQSDSLYGSEGFEENIITVEKEITIPENTTLTIPFGTCLKFKGDGKLVLGKKSIIRVVGRLITSGDAKELKMDPDSRIMLILWGSTEYRKYGTWERGKCQIAISDAEQGTSYGIISIFGSGSVFGNDSLYIHFDGDEESFDPTTLKWPADSVFYVSDMKYEYIGINMVNDDGDIIKTLATVVKAVGVEGTKSEGRKLLGLPLNINDNAIDNKIKVYDVSVCTGSALSFKTEYDEEGRLCEINMKLGGELILKGVYGYDADDNNISAKIYHIDMDKPKEEYDYTS